ncbi:magnesium/cobalt transporter CorA [Bacillus marinisedimentorum]|uniref:magnesium/cobalt transporter CorA n=1 Tax=Bacillus marinisedimentorum TaxID=1821260 RepID=UPI0007E17319|nr:magnesium/cobalt transporter CorA [Bacillus marinisedimentorum]
MIRITGITIQGERKTLEDLDMLKPQDFRWYWVDFSSPDEREMDFLHSFFHFHPLAIEDCLQKLQRPKLDYYDQYNFYVVHALDQVDKEKDEIDLFLSDHYIVTFHKDESNEVNQVWDKFKYSSNLERWDQHVVLYEIMDKIVDAYFPVLYQIEDELNAIEDNTGNRSVEKILDEVFEHRGYLLYLRNTVHPMRDLLYRMLNSHHLEEVNERREYFSDIYDHLLKLSDMIQSNREMTTDIRDSYLSLNAHQTNRIMKVLTVITTIFMPLTFIAGVYGMNFVYMPELEWRYSYFITLGLMMVIGMVMFWWFKKKGWFD